MMRRGFSINLFLADGTAEGLRIVEKSNWTGRGVVCPRSQFPRAKKRAEFDKTGVYLLRGPSPESELPTIYVGEGDPTRPRIEQHFAKKDFWTSLILFTSKDENLEANKAHVQYLEARLIGLAGDAKRCNLDNGNVPQLPHLSEPEAAKIEAFLEEMLIIYPVLGLSAFEKPEINARLQRHLLYLKGRGISAQGYDNPEGFVVLAGSEAAKDTVPSVDKLNYLLDLRQALIDNGIFADNGEHFRVSQDYAFDSPSSAAAALLGRTANGRTEWKNADGKTLKEIQETELESDAQ